MTDTDDIVTPQDDETKPLPRMGAMLGPERRYVTVDDVEMRHEDDRLRFSGHAAVFGRETYIGREPYGFWESVREGAFAKAIADGETKFLWNHDPNFPLGSTRVTEGAGSVVLREEKRGLHVRAELVPTSYARDVAALVRSGVVSGMSFAFEPIQEEWTQDKRGDHRALFEVKMPDVSIVTYPAYTETDAAMRSAQMGALLSFTDLPENQRAELVSAIRMGMVPPDLAPSLRAAAIALGELAQRCEPGVPTRSQEDPDWLATQQIRLRFRALAAQSATYKRTRT